MGALFTFTGRLSWAMAAIARVLIGIMVVLVCADVAVRNFGWRPLAWAANVSEFILLYVTFLSMPWLVRIKGHVFVEFIRGFLPPPARAALAKLAYLTCVLLCLYLFWYAVTSFWTALQRGTYETRTFDMPKWAIFLPIALAFGLSAIEWLRFLLGRDDLYNRDPAGAAL